MPALTDKVSIPAGLNGGLSSPGNAAMIQAFGKPGALSEDCSEITNVALKARMITASVGPFRVTGFKNAVEALARVFLAVQAQNAELHAAVGTAGMLCCRHVRNAPAEFSNHSWGTAVDLKIDGVLTPYNSPTVTFGLTLLAPFFLAERFYWGAGFSHHPDGMHFEASAELIKHWADGGA